jgi:hypothetical protein
MKQTVRMRVNPNFKFPLSGLDSESEPEIDPSYEFEWDPKFKPDFHRLELECSDPDVPIGMSEWEDNEEEVQILESPPIPVVDLVSEDEIKPLQTWPKRGVGSMLSSDKSDQDDEMLVERGRVVKVWGKWRRIARRTRSKKRMRVGHGRLRGKPEYFVSTNDSDVGIIRRTGGFYEPCLEDT